MAGIALPSFGGMVPRRGNQVLSNQNADFAENCLLLSGEARGLHAPIELVNFDNGTWERGEVAWAFQIPGAEIKDPFQWVPFGEERVEFLGGPLINDKHDRYYYTRTGYPLTMSANTPEPGGVPQKSDFTDSESKPTFDPITGDQQTGLMGRVVGVPAPLETNIPTLTVTSRPVPTPDPELPRVSRAYVWTVSNNFGEEGGPSEPVIEHGEDYDTWTLGNMTISAATIDKYSLTHKNIYRTVTGLSGSADYFWVAQVPIEAVSYVDNTSSAEVSLNDPLNTYLWTLPPEDLIGLTLHPNGFFVGFVGKELYFSVPYRPHAWPVNFILSTEHEIVGVGVFGSSIAVITKGHPYVCIGITPASLSLTKYQTAEPCTHFRGIVPVQGGILFPTFNGLKLMSSTGVEEISKPFLTRDEWQNIDFNNIFATRLNTQYIGFFNNAQGFLFEPADVAAGFSMLGNFWNMKNIQTDPYSGEVWILFSNEEDEEAPDFSNIVARWNPPEGAPLPHIWKSKEFVVPKPINFGIAQIDWEPADFDVEPDTAAFGRVFPGAYIIPEFVMPPTEFKGSKGLQVVPTLRFTVWADGVIIFDNFIETTRSIRLPTGFKAIRWQFQFEGNATVRHAKIAETGASLATI